MAQIEQAITDMDQVTQQNAALVEQMAAAASSLKSQANDLVQTVAVFKLSAGQGHSPLRASPAPVAVAHSPKPAPAIKAPVRKPAPMPAVSAAKPAAPKPAPAASKAAPPVLTAAAPKPAAKPVPAGGDDDWETF